MNRNHSFYQQAQQSIPGGVNSPVRAFKGVGGDPIFFEQAQGAYLFDSEHNRYLDYVGSWGPMIAGHNHPQVIQALHTQIEKGLSFGAPTELEILMAEKIKSLMPTIEMVRMVNSGTEATMSAIRLARGVTGRNKIIKFKGCYHGHSDSLLVEAGSGVLTLGIPGCPGIPASLAEHTLVAEFNDLQHLTQLFEQYGKEIAAVIVEPIAGNMGCILPNAEFLPGIRKLCDHYQSIFIVDEVMTGFRVALGGATELLNVQPDIITLGKIIGGGLPVGAFGGKKSIMSQIAPTGPVYQAGTLSGNPLAMTAGLATLDLISATNFHQQLKQHTELLVQGLKEVAKQHKIPVVFNQVCGMFSLFFTDQPSIHNFETVKKCHVERFKQFFHHMLEQKIYLAPSAFEALFISSAHQQKEINDTIQAADRAFSTLK